MLGLLEQVRPTMQARVSPLAQTEEDDTHTNRV